MDREREIVKGSVIGIVGNMVLVAFKLVVGFASNSIAIILDGVNNATDALASIVTIAGTKLSQRRPDAKHPFGYGRIEYLTAVVIGIIILIAGVASLRESILKIIHPGTPSYSTIAIIVIVVAIIAKIALGFAFAHYGKKTECEALVASGIDSNYDAVLSAGTLVVAFAQNLWGVNIDGAVGLVISLVVCKAGIDVLRDSLSPIIGTPDDARKVRDIKQYALQYPQVEAVDDIILDDFGPSRTIGQLNVEIPDYLTASQAASLTRDIARGLEHRFGIIATVGIRVKNQDDEFNAMRGHLQALIADDPRILAMHGFYANATAKTCCFDLVADFKTDGPAIEKEVAQAMVSAYPDYHFDIQIDADYQR